MLAVSAHHSFTVVAAKVDRFSSIDYIDKETNDIPADIQRSATSRGVRVFGGEIRVIWQFDDGDLDELNYVLTVQNIKPPIQREGGGNCSLPSLC